MAVAKEVAVVEEEEGICSGIGALTTPDGTSDRKNCPIRVCGLQTSIFLVYESKINIVVVFPTAAITILYARGLFQVFHLGI